MVIVAIAIIPLIQGFSKMRDCKFGGESMVSFSWSEKFCFPSISFPYPSIALFPVQVPDPKPHLAGLFEIKRQRIDAVSSLHHTFFRLCKGVGHGARFASRDMQCKQGDVGEVGHRSQENHHRLGDSSGAVSSVRTQYSPFVFFHNLADLAMASHRQALFSGPVQIHP